ncbi:MAG TPA: PQQ-dependent sugar dehydrogenase [Solirubrobacteraceae bacterium]|nr:PQQ-dependent sugar dehydrogenase [Solirubrobacteraceae bacterium]
MIAAVLLGVLAGCGDGGGTDDRREAPTQTSGAPDGGPRVQTVATNLEVPWDMTFLPGGEALGHERPGRVRLLGADGELREEPVAEIDVATQGEGGLLGVALDPRFEDNRFVYLYYTTADGMRVARHRYADGRLSLDRIILGEIAAGAIHDSGRIAFGPDSRLYVLTGDAGRPRLAQDPGSRNGKVLRMTPEQYRGVGGAAEIVSLGHRNPQGLDWEPGSGRLIATEHGPTGDDEINEIREGSNYGWPEVTGAEHGRFTAPLVVYEQTIAPSGATFVEREGSDWTGDYLVAALRGEQLRRLTFDGDRVTRNEALFEGRFGRLRTVVEGPDGAIYLLTSNRDGRGSPIEEDDRIIRVVPPGR